MDQAPHIFIQYHNSTDYHPLDSEIYQAVQQEIKRLNAILRSLFPVLLQRLKVSVGQELTEWLETCKSKAMTLKWEEGTIERATDAAASIISDSCYLDIDRWEGVGTSLTITDKNKLQKIIRQYMESLSPSDALQDLVNGVMKGEIVGEEKQNVAFFTMAAMKEDGIRQEVYDLWILEHGLEDHAPD